ncbi:MAG: DUF6801 domain-containing protein [Baekduiaceae bacterium]
MLHHAIRRSRGARRVPVAAALLGVLFASAAATPASAAPVSLTLNYTCNFPLMDPQPLKLQITSDIPSSVPVGTSTPAFDIAAKADVSAEAAYGLKALETATIGGTAIAAAEINLPGSSSPLPLQVPTTLTKATVPSSGGFSVNATGQTPPLSFSTPGTASIKVAGDLVLKLDARLADGAKTGLEDFETECFQNPGQNTTLATIVVGNDTQPPVAYGYTLKGVSALKTLTTGPVPLTGGIDAKLDLATGNYTADLVLNSTKANLKVLGTLPVKADIAFQQTDKTRGSLKAGVLTATAKFHVRLKQLYLFGVLPIAGDGQCRTKAASIANMKSTDAFFDPLKGGNLKGTYGISDLTGCGLLEAFISPLAKGGGNTIDINLTPKA